jgi:DNA-directed RNA polymerase specialized sigma24 family protein
MDRDRALAALPATYANALRLREAGLDDEAIAARLDIQLEAVRPLLEIAAAKLAAATLAAADLAARVDSGNSVQEPGENGSGAPA